MKLIGYDAEVIWIRRFKRVNQNASSGRVYIQGTF